MNKTKEITVCQECGKQIEEQNFILECERCLSKKAD